MDKDDQAYTVVRRSVVLVVGVGLLLMLMFQLRSVLLLFIAAIVFAMILNPAVSWMERHKIHRAVGTIITFVVLTVILGLFMWLVVPRLTSEIATIGEKLPEYTAKLAERIESATSLDSSKAFNIDLEKLA